MLSEVGCMSLTTYQGCKGFFQISFWASWAWKLLFLNKPSSTSFVRANDAMQIPSSKKLGASNVCLIYEII